MSRDHSLTPAEAEDRIWELADKIGTCMFTTWDGELQHSRPLAAHVDRDAHAIHFLVDADGHKNIEVEQYPQVSCAFADKGANSYVVIAGIASLSNDRDKIRDLWSRWAKAWWDDAEDPAIRLLTVVPERGEVWDGPAPLVSLAKMALAAASDGRPDMGDHAKARL